MPHGFKESSFLERLGGKLDKPFKEYQRQGGALSFNQWWRRGQPHSEVGARLTPRARRVLEGTGGVPPGVSPPTPSEEVAQDIARRQAAGVDITDRKPPTVPSGLPGFDSFDDASDALPNENWQVYRNEFGRFDIRRKKEPAPAPTGLTPFQEAEQERASEQARLTATFRTGEAERSAERARETAQFREQQQLQQQSQFQAQLDFQQEQARIAQEEQQRQFGAQLAANPINWLQYAAYTGRPPVVQPWMVPLGFQNQGGTIAPQGGVVPQGQLQVGQPIPGFQPQQFEGTQPLAPGSFSGLPALTDPSAQFLARAGPTAIQQFLGFRRARTGASPEETAFRLGSQRAPAGRFPGFSSFSRV